MPRELADVVIWAVPGLAILFVGVVLAYAARSERRPVKAGQQWMRLGLLLVMVGVVIGVAVPFVARGQALFVLPVIAVLGILAIQVLRSEQPA